MWPCQTTRGENNENRENRRCPADRRGHRRVLRVRGPEIPDLRGDQGAAGRTERLLQGPCGSDHRRVFPCLRRGHRIVAAGRGTDDAPGRRDIRATRRYHHRVFCLLDRRHARFPGQPIPAARLGAGEVRRTADRDQRGGRARGRFLPLHLAPDPGDPVFRHQSVDGPDADPDLDLLSGKPGRHARGHDRLRQRGHTVGPDHVAEGHSVAGVARRFRVAGDFPDHRQENCRLGQGTQGLREMVGPEAGDIRPQRGGDRRGVGRACNRLYRGGGQGQGHPGGEAHDGRRLPQLRLRPIEGADPFGQVSVACEALEGIRHAGR